MAVTFTKQERLFLRRVALHLAAEDKAPTPENITEAMRQVCQRDQELYERFFEIEERCRDRQTVHGTIRGTGGESPADMLAEIVYHRIRARARS